jgi:xyloglucan-specific endo-beta-1,4-glucanase
MKRICKNGGFLIQGRYYLYNNLWGADTGLGSQCLWGSSSNGSHIAWGTSWNWTGHSDSIKSYAAVVWGWHWGWKVANTGLPIQLSSIRSMYTSWSFNLTHKTPGGTNVTYDIWLSENPHQSDENPTGEIMVWLYNTGDISPIGSRQTNLIIEGIGWDLWVGDHPVSGWPVYSFVRTANTNAETLNLINFFQYLISGGLSRSVYLLSVEAGAEVFVGEGSLDTTLYSIDIERR